MKFLTLVIMMVGIIFLFNAAGITTQSGEVTTYLIENGLSSFKNTTFWTKFSTILVGAAAVGVVASLSGRAPDPTYLVAGLASVVGGAILVDMIGLYIKITSYNIVWMNYFFLAIFGIFIYGFMLSLISWWRGVDG